MDMNRFDRLATGLAETVSRRTALLRVGAGVAAAILVGRRRDPAIAQEGTPEPGDDGLPPGIGFASLLVGGIVHDMPPGPVEVRISRLTAEPGAVLPAGSTPWPFLMYIETGVSACPGGPGRVVYRPDGTVLDVSSEDGIQYVPTGTTQYGPANVLDGAGNEGTEPMSSLVIEFVPVEGTVTPPAATPGA